MTGPPVQFARGGQLGACRCTRARPGVLYVRGRWALRPAGPAGTLGRCVLHQEDGLCSGRQHRTLRPGRASCSQRSPLRWAVPATVGACASGQPERPLTRALASCLCGSGGLVCGCLSFSQGCAGERGVVLGARHRPWSCPSRSCLHGRDQGRDQSRGVTASPGGGRVRALHSTGTVGRAHCHTGEAPSAVTQVAWPVSHSSAGLSVGIERSSCGLCRSEQVSRVALGAAVPPVARRGSGASPRRAGSWELALGRAREAVCFVVPETLGHWLFLSVGLGLSVLAPCPAPGSEEAAETAAW